MRREYEVPSGIFAHEGSGRARNNGMTGAEVAAFAGLSIISGIMSVAINERRSPTWIVEDMVTLAKNAPKLLKHHRSVNKPPKA